MHSNDYYAKKIVQRDGGQICHLMAVEQVKLHGAAITDFPVLGQHRTWMTAQHDDGKRLVRNKPSLNRWAQMIRCEMAVTIVSFVELRHFHGRRCSCWDAEDAEMGDGLVFV